MVAKLNKLNKVAEDVKGLQTRMKFYAGLVEEPRGKQRQTEEPNRKLGGKSDSSKTGKRQAERCTSRLGGQIQRNNFMFYNIPEVDGGRLRSDSDEVY